MDVQHPAMARAFASFMPSKSGNHTAEVSYAGVDWIVDYDYSPSERQTHDYPGCPASVEICEVHLDNHPPHDDLSQLLGAWVLEGLEERILEQLGDY